MNHRHFIWFISTCFCLISYTTECWLIFGWISSWYALTLFLP